MDDIAEPLMSTVLKFLAGITGPVIFILLTTSIVELDSINDLTNLGFKIMGRFITAISFLLI